MPTLNTEPKIAPKAAAKTLAKTVAMRPQQADRSAGKPDAIALLRSDHEAVHRLFLAYEKARSTPRRKALVAEICHLLSVHAQIEEEIFYPEVKAALKDKLLVPEARVEHAGIKTLIDELLGADVDDEPYDAKVKVLSEYVAHHVKEEQDEMFPKAKASSLDMAELGARLAARQQALLAQQA
ncbi:hemerythrin domain-containing protein [Kinneretia aquatilis]|uniref:hemerythrin domain-containing protein n=1 Tax=Kinneretia aquatilis TaxID=2070761 RepID=UPI001CBFCD55|nr:hemerythrin domain-containing protein [Paucibacter aquatile]WIV97264.1 hemerythrin domain-containing protein [Paucibacter aquatile]